MDTAPRFPVDTLRAPTGAALQIPFTPAGTTSRPDMLCQIMMRLHGKEWGRPVEVFENPETGDIFFRGGPPDDERGIQLYRQAKALLLDALQTQELIAEVELDNGRISVSAFYWQTGSGVGSLEQGDGGIYFTGGASPQSGSIEGRIEGRIFFVERMRFDEWLERLARAHPTSSEKDEKQNQIDGASSTREIGKRKTDEMYAKWVQLVSKYCKTSEGKKRTRPQIAKAIAADKEAAHPINGKMPAASSVIRRLNERCPGWPDCRSSRAKQS